MKITMILSSILLISACGGGGGSTPNNTSGNSSGATNGAVMLSGTDTSTVGTQLDTGYVATSLAAGSQPDYIVVVDKSSTVTFTEPNILIPVTADLNNGFVLVVTDDSAGSGMKAISMSIIVSGVKHDYACTTPVTVFIECGANSITLNIVNKTVDFDNVIVTNTDTSTVLTMDGTLTW